MHYSQRLKITQGPIDEKPQQFFINAESVLGLWYNVIGIDWPDERVNFRIILFVVHETPVLFGFFFY